MKPNCFLDANQIGVEKIVLCRPIRMENANCPEKAVVGPGWRPSVGKTDWYTLEPGMRFRLERGERCSELTVQIDPAELLMGRRGPNDRAIDTLLLLPCREQLLRLFTDAWVKTRFSFAMKNFRLKSVRMSLDIVTDFSAHAYQQQVICTSNYGTYAIRKNAADKKEI